MVDVNEYFAFLLPTPQWSNSGFKPLGLLSPPYHLRSLVSFKRTDDPSTPNLSRITRARSAVREALLRIGNITLLLIRNKLCTPG
jgi:hypothetical protein